MELIINFLEEYWGYTLIGGVTFGTIVTFIIIQVKTFVRDRLKNTQIGKLLETISSLEDKNDKLVVMNAEVTTYNQHLAQVEALTFKMLSYLTIASKLTTEDKLELQADFVKLSKATIAQTGNTIVANAKDALVEFTKEGVEFTGTILKDAAQQAVSLLDKYVDAKTGEH